MAATSSAAPTRISFESCLARRVTDKPRSRAPTFDDFVALPRLLARAVPKEYEDFNGHMNVTGFLRLHDEAALPFMRLIEMGDDYITGRRLTIFDLEHHLRYLTEVMIDAPIAIHARTLARSSKVIHGQWYLLDLGQERLANTFEFLSAHVSLVSRRTTEFPDEVAAGLDAQIAQSADLDWDPPISGALTLRS